MYRLFVAIELPEWVKAELSGLSFGLPGAHWVPDDQLHLTLRFIGEVDRFQFEEIARALSEVQIDPFDLALEGVGTFPPRGKPNVLWVGIEKSEPLLQLHRRVEKALVQVGVEPEKRKFSPHITLARLKDAPLNRLGEFLMGHSLFKVEPFEIEEFHLFSSQLTSKGAIHTLEATYSLLD
ncbi:MAG: 2-5 ligase [Chloroflexi bacterium]|jgi:2'-5' RNA ligase|nr:2-5 ligase [Chloroflexota bacterium]